MTATDSLVSDIYAAANGRVEWAKALGNIADFLDLWTVQILGLDRKTGQLMFSVHGGKSSPETALDYFREYSAIDPRAGFVLTAPPNSWIHCHEHCDEAFVAQNRFYQDFLIPHGGRYGSGTVLIDSEDVVFVLALLRGVHRNPAGPEDMPMMNHFRFHFAEAMRNLVHVREAYAELGMARELLSQFSYPMLLIDETRGIWHRNDSAIKLLDEGNFAMDRGGVLACRDKASDSALAEAIYSLDLSSGKSSGSLRRAVPIKGADGNPCIALISAIQPTQTMGAFGHSARALVVFHNPAKEGSALDPFIVGECFDLTPAEARVAVRIARGDSSKEIAQQTGAALATVRSHLQRIMEKTGVTRQIDLVRVLLALPARLS